MAKQNKLETGQDIMVDKIDLLHKKIEEIQIHQAQVPSVTNDDIMDNVDILLKSYSNGIINNLRIFDKNIQADIRKECKVNFQEINALLNANKNSQHLIAGKEDQLEMKQLLKKNYHLSKSLAAYLNADDRKQLLVKNFNIIQDRLKWYGIYHFISTVLLLIILVSQIYFTNHMNTKSYERGKKETKEEIEAFYNVKLNELYED
ncbi:hypothetical protein [Nonlabens agnitus]|uniref:Uncharacterized protein n=1 Tax=Nonlabens agnitus TaxID=870484 RepID=A0A2S9WSK2_9FLAO|nr:hypothetical protein [Nonlabens agnitus]PRP66276.1 hypothetical protein BST86_03800 [Nonlabens agnitus]